MDAGERVGLPPGMAVSITVIRGPDVGTKFEMTGPKVVVGRKRGDLMLRDRETSGIHCSIEQGPDGRFILRDLGSTNGTFLDGRRVTVGEIQSGQQIRIGSNYLLFTMVAESASDTTRHAPIEVTGQHAALPAEPFGFGRASAWPSPQPAEAPPLPATREDEPREHPTDPVRLPGSEPKPFEPFPTPPSLPAARKPEPALDGPFAVPSSAPLAAGPFDGPLGSANAAPPAAVASAPAWASSAGWTGSGAEAPPASQGASSPPPPAPEASLPTGVERSIYGVYLLVERGKDRGKVFPINRQVTVLGRSGTEILINDPDISRRHAALDVQGNGKYILRDLASTNGTLLNGVRVQTESMQANDKIRMGGTTIKLLVGDERVASELRRIESEPVKS